jgi:hypothetical protein
MQRLLAGLALFLCAAAGWAAQLDVTLSADPQNPATPQMGDRLKFVSVLENKGSTPASGVVAWISLVQMDPGHEQPVDLEDWSAHKAETRAEIKPGERVSLEWPMRLIQAGSYRVLVSAVDRDAPRAAVSPFIDFHVKRKPVVESQRVLPVAFGVPLVIGAAMLVRRRRWRRPN